MSVGFDLNINTASGVQALKSLTKIAENLSETFSHFTTSFADLGKVIKPVDSVATSINRLGSGFKNLANFTDSAIIGITLLGDELSKNDSILKNSFKEIAELSSEVSGIAPGFNNAATSIRRFGEGLRTTATYAEEFKSQISGQKKVDGNIVNITKIQTSIKDLYKSLGRINPSEITQFDTISVSLNRLSNSFKKFSGSSNFSAVLEANSASLRKMIDSFGSASAFSPAVAAGFSSISRALSSFTNSLVRIDKISKDFDKLGSSFSSIVNRIRNFINQVNQMASTNMKAFVRFERLSNSIYRAAEGLKYFKLASGQATSATDQLSNALQRATRSTNWLAGGWKTVVTAFAGGTVIYTVVNFIKQAIKSFGEFDFQLRQINTIARQTESGLRDIGNAILAISSKYGKSADDVARAMFAITTATIEGVGALEVLIQSAKLAVAGNTDLEGSAQLLSRIIKAYGKTAYEASHLVDVLYMTQERGITTIRELNADLGKVIGTAAAASVSFEELNAAVATLTTRGLKTNIATTALNSLILKLSSDTEKLNPIFQRLGYESTSVALKQLGLAGVMRQLQQATGGTSAGLIKLGFNFRDIRAATILANDVGGQYAKNLSLISNESSVANKATSALEEAQKSLVQQLNEILETIKANIINITEFIATFSGFKIILGVINWFTQLKSSVNSFFGFLKPIVGTVFQVVSAFAVMTTTIILLTGTATKLITGLRLLRRAFLRANVAEFSKNTNIAVLGITRLSRYIKTLVADFNATRNSMLAFNMQTVTFSRAMQVAVVRIKAFYTALKMSIANIGSFIISLVSATRASVTFTSVAAFLRVGVLSLAAAFKVLWKAVLGPLALVLIAFEAIELAWTAISNAIETSKANAYLEETSQYVEELGKNFDRLFTQGAIDVRIAKIEKEIEKLNKLPVSEEVTRRIRLFSKYVEELNNKKINLGLISQEQLNALNAFNTELDKIFEKKMGDFGNFAFLKVSIDAARVSLTNMEKGSTKWLNTMTELMKMQSKYNALLMRFNEEARKQANNILSIRGNTGDDFSAVNTLEQFELSRKTIQKSMDEFRKSTSTASVELDNLSKVYFSKDAIQAAANAGAEAAENFAKGFNNELAKMSEKVKTQITKEMSIDLQKATSGIEGFSAYFTTERSQEELTGLANSINALKDAYEKLSSVQNLKANEDVENNFGLALQIATQLKGIMETASLPTGQIDKTIEKMSTLGNTTSTLIKEWNNYDQNRGRDTKAANAAVQNMRDTLKKYAEGTGKNEWLAKIEDGGVNALKRMIAQMNTEFNGLYKSIRGQIQSLTSGGKIDVFSQKLDASGFGRFSENMKKYFEDTVAAIEADKKLNELASKFGVNLGESIQNAFGSYSITSVDTYLKDITKIQDKFKGLPTEVQGPLKDIIRAASIGAADVGQILTDNLLNAISDPALKAQVMQFLNMMQNEVINVFSKIKQAREDLLDFRASALGDSAQLQRLQQKYAKIMKSLQNTNDAAFGLKLSKEAQSLLSQINSLQESMHGGTVTITTVEQMESGSKQAFDILARATSNDYQKSISANVTNIVKETDKISRELSRIEKNTRNKTNTALSVQTPNGVQTTT